MKKEKKSKSQLNSYARFSGIGFQMIAIIGLGVYCGIKLDERYPNDYQGFTAFLSLAGVAIALYTVIKQVNKHSKKQNSNEQKNH